MRNTGMLPIFCLLSLTRKCHTYLEENSPSTVLPPNRYSSSFTAVNVCRVKPGGVKVEFTALKVQLFETASQYHNSDDKLPSDNLPPNKINPLPYAQAECPYLGSGLEKLLFVEELKNSGLSVNCKQLSEYDVDG